MRVAVYCAASDPGIASPRDHQMVREVARAIVARGWEIVYGGGAVGLMGLLADAALEAGGNLIGVIPEELVNRELAHPGVADMRTVASNAERVRQFLELGDAHLMLPGGIGTYSEMIWVWSHRYLGMLDAPLVCCDPTGTWNDHFAAWRKTAGRGYVTVAELETCSYTSDIELALDACEGKPVPAWAWLPSLS